ncbi:MAG TPA: ECF transporter S component [Candidatus Limnocylindria bacterium]|jgi:energy-coupling factor transport system substrate-specific component|nr:ECF transporter S component [Candidatus Limnocylindria bacterium]
MTSMAAPQASWRVVDIVVASVLGVAFGVVFQVWNGAWELAKPVFIGFPPVQGLMYGIWLVPAVLVPLVVRRPGAALLAELVAAAISALLGAQWGLQTLVYGLLQGAAAELAFAFTLYRSWNLVTAMLAAAFAGAAAVLLDLVFYYPDWNASYQITYAIVVVISTALLAGIGSWLLVRSLANAGVLNAFPAGREQPEV